MNTYYFQPSIFLHYQSDPSGMLSSMVNNNSSKNKAAKNNTIINI